MAETNLQTKVLEALEDSDTPLNPNQLEALLQISPEAGGPSALIIRGALLNLKEEQLVRETSPGLWTVTESNRPPGVTVHGLQSTTPPHHPLGPAAQEPFHPRVLRKGPAKDPTNPDAIFEQADNVPTLEEDAETVRQLSIPAGDFEDNKA